MAAVRRLLHGLSDTSAETDPIAKVDASIKRFNYVYRFWYIKTVDSGSA